MMAKKKFTSRPGLFGSTNHYDSSGNKIGESHTSFWGGSNTRLKKKK